MGMMDYALNSHITALRFPGGNWGDQNDVTDYQIDAFVVFCKQIGAIPTISVRLLGGTPEVAAQLVKYVNVEKGYNVRYWSIGNEPDLYDGIPNVDYDTVRFNQEWRAIAEIMKAVDPTILLLGPELHGTFTSNFTTNPKDSAGRDWMTEFLKANGDMVDIVTYHRYPFPVLMNGINATIDDLRQDSPEWTRTVRYLRQLIQETTGGDIPIAVTEAGSHYTGAVRGEATPDSFYNAIWWSDVLGRLINENVVMVNQWLLTTSSGQSDGLGLIAIGKVRPTYYVYQMYQHFGTERVYTSSGVTDVSVYAAKRDDGKLTIIVINLSDVEKHMPLQIKGMTPSTVEVWLFDATHNAENLGQLSLLANGSLVLPPQSVTLYIPGE
jgi:alpha-L-arabinofuranosidase